MNDSGLVRCGEAEIRRPLLATLIVVPLIALGAVGWYYSVEILGPDAPRGRTGQAVLARTDSTITLAATPKARRPGYWAIEWPGGFGRIGPLISEDDRQVVTRFEIAARRVRGGRRSAHLARRGLRRRGDPLAHR
jgi:hypothetical protein